MYPYRRVLMAGILPTTTRKSFQGPESRCIALHPRRMDRLSTHPITRTRYPLISLTLGFHRRSPCDLTGTRLVRKRFLHIVAAGWSNDQRLSHYVLRDGTRNGGRFAAASKGRNKILYITCSMKGSCNERRQNRTRYVGGRETSLINVTIKPSSPCSFPSFLHARKVRSVSFDLLFGHRQEVLESLIASV